MICESPALSAAGRAGTRMQRPCASPASAFLPLTNALASTSTGTHPVPSDQPNSKQPAGTPSPAAMAHSQPEGAWREFVDHAFFAPCARHAAGCSARDSTTNWWSFTSHQPACSVCVAGSPLETYIQARRGRLQGGVPSWEADRRAASLGPCSNVARPSFLWSMSPLAPTGARNGPGATRCPGQRRRPAAARRRPCARAHRLAPTRIPPVAGPPLQLPRCGEDGRYLALCRHCRHSG